MIPDSWDIELKQNAQRLARMLLEVRAVRFDADRPARHGSGVVSPIHVEGRLLLSYPRFRAEVIDLSLRMIECEIGRETIDAIAAYEGAGVPFATLIAERLRLPLLFVRKESSGRSYKDRVEGPLLEGMRILPVDQLATDGRRKPALIDPLRRGGGRIDRLFVLFQYGVFDVIHENLSRLDVTLHALCTWWDLLDAAEADHALDRRTCSEIRAFLADPGRWSEERGGQAEAA